MNLFIDIGNTSMHWRLSGKLEHASPSVSVRHNKDWQKALNTMQTTLGDAEFEHVLISSVAGSEVRSVCADWFDKTYKVNPEFVVPQAKFNSLVNAYEQASQLGVDRWLAVLAGMHRIQSEEFAAALVVDAGTAMTIDAVLQNGKHLGGNIIAGLELQQSVLLKNTSEIAESHGEESVWGTNTASAVSNGAYFALVGAILLAYQQLRFGLPEATEIQLLLTGGDAETLEHYFSSQTEISFSVHSNLVLDGLEVYLGASA